MKAGYSLILAPIVLVAVFCLPAAKRAQAVPIAGSATGLSAPEHTVSFSEVSLAEPTPIAGAFLAYGVSFDNLFYDTNYSGIFGNMSGPDARNWTNDQFNRGTTHIYFTAPVSDAAFALVTGSGLTLFTSYLHGNPVESFSAAAPTTPGNLNDFFGFANSFFDEIAISVTPTNPQNSAVFDNVQFNTAIPEPASIALFGWAALVGLMKGRRQTRGSPAMRKFVYPS